MSYALVVLPIALQPLTYRAGDEPLCPGMAVMVGIGPRKLCQGIVWAVSGRDPGFPTRPVERVLYGGRPLLDGRQMEFWEWMASYYMCSLGEVMAAALPALLRPEGFSHEEFGREEFRRPTTPYVRLHPQLDTPGKLHEAFESLARARAQYAALVELVGKLDDRGASTDARIPRAALQAPCAVLRRLEEKGMVLLEDLPEQQQAYNPETLRLPLLTPAQQEALRAIENQPTARPATLLHGVTGSGKTEIFINLAARVLARGQSVLYLLPEIPISWQIIGRLEKVFGEQVVAYHSKFTARQRAALFLRQASQSAPRLVIGTRTALFLPLHDLGLVVVDEEHDTSFKQDAPAPRFHARDAALMLAGLHGAHTVLGSATPSLESYYHAITDKYGLVRLTERYGGVPMPHVLLSDSLRAARRGERNVHFNKLLLDKMDATLAAGGQAILLQNRRGFSPYVECGACSWVAHCPDCNVTLTLHKGEGRLRCHYCGYTIPAPHICPSCGQGELLPRGFGTEKIEDELGRVYPEVKTGRLDGDTAASPRAARQLIASFERGETQVLVGTQMVTKGFDFRGVGLVGVVNADNLLNYPDFRASERAFQTLTQAAGRAGRSGQQGEVVIQSTQTGHPVLTQVVAGDYDAMARSQLAERRSFFYPPYCRLISITLRHKDQALADQAAAWLASALRPVFGSRVLGPEPPAVDRVMGEHIRLLLLKIERGKSFARAKELLATHMESFRNHPQYRKVTLVCNVDPQ